MISLLFLLGWLGSAALTSAIARRLGASKKLAVILALVPTALLEVSQCVSIRPILRDSDGNRISGWSSDFLSLLIPAILALVVANLVKRKPERLP